MDFRIDRPLESGCKNFITAPAFRPCANKIRTYLLDSVASPICRGSLPRRLEVKTISAIMADVVEGQSDSPQLEIQGNYRAATAQDMDKVYSRNLANRKLPASGGAQVAFRDNKSLESVKGENPVFLENTQQYETGAFDIEFGGLKHHDWACGIRPIR